MNIIESFIGAFKSTVLNKTFYRKLNAYGCVIGGMKYDDDDNKDLPVEEWKPTDKYWQDELPSVFELDLITKEMNAQREDINKTFKLNVSCWDRDEVRSLMNAFEKAYNAFCSLYNKKFTIFEVCAKFYPYMSFWTAFTDLMKAK